MAERATRDRKVTGSIPPGSNEIVFLNINHNDGYIVMINNWEPNIGVVCKPVKGPGCRAFTMHAGHG